MNVIIYSSIINEQIQAMCNIFAKTNHHIGIEFHRSINSLQSRIRQPLKGIILVLLNVWKQEDLQNLIALKDILSDLPVILIMHDTKEDALNRIRLLRPRFIFGGDDNLEEIALVIDKMLSKLGR